MAVIMLDTVDPDAIPDTWNGPVAGYHNGHFAWPAAAFRAHRKHGYIKIGVHSGAPSQAEAGRALDIEMFDATPADALPFLKAREAAGHHDATLYGSLNAIPAIVRAIGHHPCRLWVAWYWGKPGFPSRELVVHELAVRGVGLAEDQHVWATQYLNDQQANLDYSVVYGRKDFSHG